MGGDPRWEPFSTLGSELTPQQRHRAVRTVASYADSADDLADLLAMLGLTPADGQPPPPEPPAPPRRSGLPAQLLAELAELRRLVERSCGT